MAEFENGQKEAEQCGPAGPYVSSFETGRRYRAHWSYILTGTVIAALIVLALAIIGQIVANSITIMLVALYAWGLDAVVVYDVVEFLTGPIVALILFAVFTLLFALEWRSITYSFDQRAFSSYSGVFTKKVVHVPYSRIYSINYHANIFQRIFGTCTINIDCIGNAATGAPSVACVKIKDAERMRTELAMRKAAVEAGMEASVVFAPDIEAPFDDEPVDYEYKLSTGELFQTAVTNDKPAIVAYVVLLLAIIVMSVAMLMQAEFVETIADIAFLIVVVAMVAVWVFGLLPILSAYGGFRVRCRGSRIEVERGALTRNYSSIDIERVQTIEMQQSPIRRLSGFCELSFGRISAPAKGFDLNKLFRSRKKAKKAEEVKGLIVHPCVKVDRGNEILANLAAGLSGQPSRAECKRPAKGALSRALIRECAVRNRMFWVVVAFVLIRALVDTLIVPQLNLSKEYSSAFEGFLDESFILIVALAALLTLSRLTGAIRWARRSGYTWNSRYLLLWNDGRSTNQTIIPRQKIQAGVSRSTFFQRRKSLATLEALTVLGSNGAVASLVDVPAEDADAYLEWLKPHCSAARLET